MSVREVAAATGRKESTIRVHVKHMFTKHGLSRQTELVRLVLPLASSPDTRRSKPHAWVAIKTRDPKCGKGRYES